MFYRRLMSLGEKTPSDYPALADKMIANVIYAPAPNLTLPFSFESSTSLIIAQDQLHPILSRWVR